MLYFTRETTKEIMQTIGMLPPEHGGIIGGIDDTICCFYYDMKGECSKSYYMPDVINLNKIIKQWTVSGKQFYGIIHSHELGDDRLSFNDKGSHLFSKRLWSESFRRLFFRSVEERIIFDDWPSN